MEKIKAALEGKKTYILLAFGALAVIIDYLGGVGLTPFCTEQLKTQPTCTMTVSEMFAQLGALGVFGTIRAAISNNK